MRSAAATPLASTAPDCSRARRRSRRALERRPMKTSALFTPDPSKVDALVAVHPLAHLVSLSAEGLVATPLPLLLERDASGRATLLGHFARANPHVEHLEARPEALVIFMGPQGYIVVVVHGSNAGSKLELRDGAFDGADRDRPFTDSGARSGRPAERTYGARAGSGVVRCGDGQPLRSPVAHVVAFRAEVLGCQAKFKLGQNERADVLAEALVGSPATAIRRFTRQCCTPIGGDERTGHAPDSTFARTARPRCGR